ncbi:MAG: HAMP domain-containing sensor histidine kinase [Prolixibacteraceae bacterium]|jgi:K+-sensing histidine kinase KdpD
MNALKTIPDQYLKSADFRLISHTNPVETGYAQMIGTISHELRTPVSVLKSNIQLFKEFGSFAKEEIKNESISMCEDSVAELIHFLDEIQVLNASIKSGLKPKFSTFQVKSIVDNLSDTMAKTNLDFSRVKIKWILAIKKIYSDQSFIAHILVNLLSNALKFSNGNILLTISANKKQLSLLLEDSGIGIAENEFEAVFKPFYRAENAKRKPGVGLGLAAVSALTASLRGNIYIASTQDIGTILKIILPHETSN